MCTPQKDSGDSGTDKKTGAKLEGGRAKDVEMFAESDQKGQDQEEVYQRNRVGFSSLD